MKKTLFSLAVLFIAVVSMISCGSKSDPKSVALNYLNALKQMDYENAKKFGTPETGKMLDMISSFSSMIPDSVKNEAKKVKIEIKDVKEEGDKATVKFVSSDKPENEESLNLVKKDGKWLVNMTKDDMGGGAAEEGAAPPADDAVAEPAEGAAAEPASKDSVKVDAQ
ncbi:MAG: DUF4878 domain-containing protein [Chitinophagaceae bacterium]|nr:DUF4878 domain-containing protein [Chitinophagaceae bacterium]